MTCRNVVHQMTARHTIACSVGRRWPALYRHLRSRSGRWSRVARRDGFAGW